MNDKTTHTSDSHGEVEMQIRSALQQEASAYDVPGDLAARTLEAVGVRTSLSRRERLAAWLDARKMPSPAGSPPRRTPRWTYAAAVPVVVGLFVVGSVLTDDGRGGQAKSTVTANALLKGGVSGAPVPADQGNGSAGGLGSGPQGGQGATSSPGAATRVPPPEAGLLVPGQPGQGAKAPEPDTVAVPAPIPAPMPGGGPVGPARLVRTVDLEVRVRPGEFEQQWSAANNVAERHGGFVTSSSADVQRSGSTGTFVMRVPTDKLEAALTDLRRLGTLVRMNRSGYDVSGQLADSEARLRNLRAQEAQLLELLKQAKSVGDVLEIRGRLDGLRQEIESVDGQRAGVQQDVDLSTIQFTLRDSAKGSTAPQEKSKVERAFTQAGDAFTTTLAGFVLAIGYLGPFAMLILVAWVVLRFRRRVI